MLCFPSTSECVTCLAVLAHKCDTFLNLRMRALLAQTTMMWIGYGCILRYTEQRALHWDITSRMWCVSGASHTLQMNANQFTISIHRTNEEAKREMVAHRRRKWRRWTWYEWLARHGNFFHLCSHLYLDGGERIVSFHHIQYSGYSFDLMELSDLMGGSSIIQHVDAQNAT